MASLGRRGAELGPRLETQCSAADQAAVGRLLSRAPRRGSGTEAEAEAVGAGTLLQPARTFHRGRPSAAAAEVAAVAAEAGRVALLQPAIHRRRFASAAAWSHKPKARLSPRIEVRSVSSPSPFQPVRQRNRCGNVPSALQAGVSRVSHKQPISSKRHVRRQAWELLGLAVSSSGLGTRKR